MSVEAISWALNYAPAPRDSNGQRSTACVVVLIALANHADPEGRNAFPSVERLCKYTALSERSVRLALERLHAEGIIRPGNDTILAAHIVRGDRRPRIWDLSMHMCRPAEEIPAGTPRLASLPPSSGVQRLHLVEMDHSGDGVQPLPERGAVAAPETSYNQNSSTSDVADAPPDDAGKERREDVEAICSALHAGMAANRFKTPDVIGERWRDAARLMLDRDARPLDEALAVLAWSQRDEFWKANVRSVSKFREQYDVLRTRWEQAGRPRVAGSGSSREAIRQWLLGMWQDATVKPVEERSGLRFPVPDVPDHVTNSEQAREFQIEARRQWIKDNNHRIIEAIIGRESRKADAA